MSNSSFHYIHNFALFIVSVFASLGRFLILATDGLWDFLTNEEAVRAVDSCKDKSLAADLLVNMALSKAAEEFGMDIADLKLLPPGKHRRAAHDDTTVIVIYF